KRAAKTRVPKTPDRAMPGDADARPARASRSAESAPTSPRGLPGEAEILARLMAQGKRPHSIPSLEEAFQVPVERSRDFTKLMKRLEEQCKVRRVKGRKYVAVPPEEPGSAGVDAKYVARGAARQVQAGAADASKGSRWASMASTPQGPGRNREERRKSRGRYPGQVASDYRPKAEEGLIKGKIVKVGGFHFLQPLRAEEGRLSELAVLVPRKHLGRSQAGDIVTVRILDEEDGERIGKVIGTLSHDIAFPDVSKAFFKEYGLPHGYPKKAIAEAAVFPEPVHEDHSDREDYRDRHVITIDPATARDHDDAISLERKSNGNWRLGVHIADVAEYVLPDTELDAEALGRAFTQYLPWTAAPMLPPRLSSDLCSLLEHRDRLAFSCIMEVAPDGELLDFEFVETFIRVAKFYSYEEAQGAREEGDPFLALLDEFTAVLLKRRRADGFIDFSFPEPKMELDEEGVPARIYIGQRLASHSWIEECMLLANQATAKFLTKHKIPGLFRVHEQPDIEAVAGLWASQGALHKDKGMAETLKNLNETRTYLNPAVQKFFIRLLSQEGGALPASVQRSILQSMKKAQYSAQPLGHFALGWLHYAHFTSPIRRYADLWTHRVIKAFLRKAKVPRNMKVLAADVADRISEREIAVMKVERKGLKTATAWVLRQYVGEEFIGEVSGAENFGLFVSITNPYGEGLVPVRFLRDDYYEKDEETGNLVGRRTGARFALGDKVRVRLERSDPFTAQVDFAYLGRP
ncbi:MAG TPA: RNB domain-containing ribonuclease, partial [Fibrobacteria bacterium]|nr:RNB domain-containing ribonuclease [Fibrobacteria bacterium]